MISILWGFGVENLEGFIHSMLSPLSSMGVLRNAPQSSTRFGSLPGTDIAEIVVTNKAFSEDAKKASLRSSMPEPNITSHSGSSKKIAQNNS